LRFQIRCWEWLVRDFSYWDRLRYIALAAESCRGAKQRPSEQSVLGGSRFLVTVVLVRF
jgi:hypothetical protein